MRTVKTFRLAMRVFVIPVLGYNAY